MRVRSYVVVSLVKYKWCQSSPITINSLTPFACQVYTKHSRPARPKVCFWLQRHVCNTQMEFETCVHVSNSVSLITACVKFHFSHYYWFNTKCYDDSQHMFRRFPSCVSTDLSSYILYPAEKHSIHTCNAIQSFPGCVFMIYPVTYFIQQKSTAYTHAVLPKVSLVVSLWSVQLSPMSCTKAQHTHMQCYHAWEGSPLLTKTKKAIRPKTEEE